MYGVGLAVDDELGDDERDVEVLVGVVAVSIGSTSTSPELPTSIIPFKPPATERTLFPTTTAPPTPTPTTIHPTWALAVWPLLTVTVLVTLITGCSVEVALVLVACRVVVKLAGVVAGGDDDFGVVDVG